MGWIIDKTVTEPIEVESNDGDKATVYLRKMDEGDFSDRQNQVAKMKFAVRKKSKGKGGSLTDNEQDMTYAIGEIRRFDLRRSIVKWDLPIPLNETNISALDPYVAEQIHTKIADMNPFIFGGSNDDEEEVEVENPETGETELKPIES